MEPFTRLFTRNFLKLNTKITMEQNYKNHARMVPGYHYVLGIFLVAGFSCSLVYIYRSGYTEAHFPAALICMLYLIALFIAAFTRSFSLKAQDRAIRAEENFRHYVLTGKALPSELNIRQIVGLRFASDAEFPKLAEKAAKEGLSEKAIKLEIKNWKADTYRV